MIKLSLEHINAKSPYEVKEANKLARIIKRSMKQVETEPSMTPEEAIEHLRAL